MAMWKFMDVSDFCNVDMVCTVIFCSYPTYTFTNLQLHAITIPSQSGYEYTNTPEQGMHFNP
jgi:hypothetical protein